MNVFGQVDLQYGAIGVLTVVHHLNEQHQIILTVQRVAFKVSGN